MQGLAVVGGVVGVWLFATGWSNSTAVTIDQHHLVYGLGVSPWIAGVPYVAATCGALLLSTHRFVRRFGAALFASLTLTLAVAAVAFSSVWCFFAAVLSVGLYVHYRLERAGGAQRVDLLSS
jgi:hypothetical protein